MFYHPEVIGICKICTIDQLLPIEKERLTYTFIAYEDNMICKNKHKKEWTPQRHYILPCGVIVYQIFSIFYSNLRRALYEKC